MQKTPRPPFPEPGSIIGSYFCLGKLGKGTFCSIHKCIDLSYFHNNKKKIHSSSSKSSSKSSSNVCNGRTNKLRIVAAKVELSTFINSGVIDGEATVLQNLSSQMPREMIPVFFSYNKTQSSSKVVSKGEAEKTTPSISAIIMEYLAGEDMHQLRDRHQRRLAIPDAVYLCADVMLPLLKAMHRCGVIHRDVKPSNCVRKGTTQDDRGFKIVDFGLSKSFIVPEGSSFADERYPWDAHRFLRKERVDAEFRGTSMYASLRVHQLRDYCRRDDIWGLMYVFCDLVSGGLPWMCHAAIRDRNKCQVMKEWIHGERHTDDSSKKSESDGGHSTTEKKCHIEELLKGSEYHSSKYKREFKKEKKVPEDKLPSLTQSLYMSNDKKKINALTEAFDHLAKLKFQGEPDYGLIERCLRAFLPPNGSNAEVSEAPPLKWKQPAREEMDKRRWERKIGKMKEPLKSLCPTLTFHDSADFDPLKENTLDEAEREIQFIAAMDVDGENTSSSTLSPKVLDLMRLPIHLQYRLAQVEYNSANHKTIPIHLAFRDWMALGMSLVYETWDSKKYERGNHRKNDDKFQREHYMRLVEQCLKAAEPFEMFFGSKDCFYHIHKIGEEDNANRKRRKISTNSCDKTSTKEENIESRGALMELSKINFALRAILKFEQNRTIAPPPMLSFGS